MNDNADPTKSLNPVLVRAALDVATEREWQINRHGYSAEFDDLHKNAELARAGAAVALRAAAELMQAADPHVTVRLSQTAWPFDNQVIPLASPRQMLVIAASLIMAEIARLDRLAAAARSAT